MPVLIASIGLLILLVCVVLIRTMRFRPAAAVTNPEPLQMPPNPEAIAEKMSAVIRIPSISFPTRHPEREQAMRDMHAELERQFPLFHVKAEKTVINEFSLAYRWKGKSDTSPRLVLAHMDVVPIAPGTEEDWTHPPFSGEIADGFVWGRGTLDIKSHLVCSLEAAEWLMAEGFVPEQDIWFAFGHDEEIGGPEGAMKMEKWFAGKGIHFSWLLDEGGLVNDGAMKGLDRPLALIGIGEKGYADIRFTARDEGGHASMPPKHSALGTIATFVHRLEGKPMKTRLVPPVWAFLNTVGRYQSFGLRLILANLWLFKPLFLKVFSAGRTGNAMLRTTAAPTMAKASNAMNVLPQSAEAIVNFRILHGDTCDTLLEHLNKVAKGLGIEIEPDKMNDPSAISKTEGPVWARMAEGIGRLYPEAIPVPYLMMGATDARKYEAVSDNQYRFTAYRISTADLKRIHGTDERISVDNLNRCVAFFRYMMEG